MQHKPSLRQATSDSRSRYIPRWCPSHRLRGFKLEGETGVMRRTVKVYLSALLIFSFVFGISYPAVADDNAASNSKLDLIMQLLQNYYKDPVSNDALLDGAIKGAVNGLGDPYTNYFSATEYKQFLDSLSGTFSGIGAFVRMTGSYLTIERPIAGSPAEKAGLQPGDKVLEINGEKVVGQAQDVQVSKIKGKTGTTVHLKLQRPMTGKIFEVDIVRATIQAPNATWKMLDAKTGYIELVQFAPDAAELVQKAVTELKAQGAQSLVLDLRNNPGGYLDQALRIASMFVPKGEPVMREDRRGGTEVVFNSDGNNHIDLPTVVLVNENSASASEILAGALKDYAIAPLVGKNTFGKGTVQQLFPLTDGSGLKITIAEYLTAKAHHVHKVGIAPDYAVEATDLKPERVSDLSFSDVLRYGKAGLDVLAVQERLNDLGYEAGPENGVYGALLDHAVINFQKDHHLVATAGIMDLATRDALNEAVDQAVFIGKDAHDLQLKKALELLAGKHETK